VPAYLATLGLISLLSMYLASETYRSDLSGQAAGSGMGAACARELVEQGYAVALMSPSGKAEALAKELGGLGLTGSVTEEADLEALVGETLDRYGRIDGVVNSTGHPASGES
jgi:NAD(P)-dependent dehydrogenase (short-subunit alcohol dehydrogenase family)